MIINHIYKGHKIRKRFGQNFLCDLSIINFIVDAINPKLDQAVVEIGPGLGALTEPISKFIDNMTVIELDRNLVDYLNNHPLLHTKINIIQQDVMKTDFRALYVKKGLPLRIFGNLPYNISISLIFRLFEYIDCIYDMHFMLQKEVVNRLIASPNSKVYGRLSVMAQYYCNIIQILKVPSTSFYPRPKVDSALVRLIPYIKPLLLVKDVNNLSVLTSIAFNQRRKMIRNSLRSLFNIKQLEKQHINTKLRAENLSVKHYCQLANMLTNHSILRNE